MTNVNLNASIISQTSIQQTRGNQQTHYRQVQQTQVDVSISIDSDPLTLAYQAAIDKINEQVAPFLGDSAIQRGYNEGIDVTPEATASRILDFATNLFSRFQAQYPNESLESVTARFVDVIGSGVAQGFGEARDILGGLGVLEGDIASNIDKTFELVMQGLKAFSEEILG